MAVKKATAKATAKRATPKPKAKPKAKAAVKAKAKPAVKVKATAARKAPRAKAKQATKPRKAHSPPATRKAREEQARAVATVPQLDLFPADVLPPVQPKKGPLARLAGGVGSLLARVTGKRKSPVSDQAPEHTIELATADILAVTAAPPPIPKRKR